MLSQYGNKALSLASHPAAAAAAAAAAAGIPAPAQLMLLPYLEALRNLQQQQSSSQSGNAFAPVGSSAGSNAPFTGLTLSPSFLTTTTTTAASTSSPSANHNSSSKSSPSSSVILIDSFSILSIDLTHPL